MAKIAVIPKTARTQDKKVRVAAYCRVSTDHKDQTNSYEAQVRYFSGLYSNSKTEVLVDIYADATVIIGLKQNPTHGRRFSPIFFA